jgi:hypothetical protein
MLCRLSCVFWNERRSFLQVTYCRDQDAVGVYNTGGKDKGTVGGKKGYIYSSSGDFLVQLVSFVSKRTQNGPAFIFQNHM